MSIIKQMDAKLANMIAAGEVVERPASIIKELVENSIDANSSTIDIFVTDNGLKSILITDNGVGMSLEDAKKSTLRHATSKISSKHDLERIKTLGFRGEALAAIAAVSDLEITTRTKDSDAYYLKYVDSKLVLENKTSHNVGTSIQVNNLFHNTPARLKYLKSEYSEKSAIIETFNKLALSNPNIRFTLTIDEKIVKETFGNNDYYSLLAQIYGINILNDIKTFDETFANINVKGFLISPQITRARRNDITIFVNGRYIKNYNLTQAIIDGYNTFIMTNRYPLALIFIEIDPYLLDVNVHPQKLEVKFANESLLKYQIEQFVKKTLRDLKHEIKKPFRVLEQSEKQQSFIREELDFVYEENEVIHKIPDFDYIGNLASTYLLFQNENGLYLIDQHAAEERVNYEYYSNLFLETKTVVTEMFVPRHLNITLEDLDYIKNNIKIFNNLGFYFNEDVFLTAHPNYLKDKDIDDAIINIITLSKEEKVLSTSLLVDNLAKSRSCKASIKASDRLSPKEVESLIKRLRQAKNPYTCPHGRPTIINISHYEIAKMFKRIV